MNLDGKLLTTLNFAHLCQKAPRPKKRKEKEVDGEYDFYNDDEFVVHSRGKRR